MDKPSIFEHVNSAAETVAKAKNIELVHVEVAGTKRDLIIRIYIDKEGGVTLDDCSGFSRGVEEVLDVEDRIPVRYVLEVSSPGIERELYSLKDFEKFTGELVKIKIKEAIDGQKTFVGPLTGIDGDKITIEDRSKGIVTFTYSDVNRANLKIDLAKEFGGR